MIPWGGVCCCLGAGLYLLGRSSGRDAEALRSVPRINQLKELALLLDTACNIIPPVVSVSGRVGSDSPINCKHSSLRGVIVEETAEQHFLKHNDAGSWVQDSTLMLCESKEVPWYLDDGTGRVLVVGARRAAGLDLMIASEVLEESSRSLIQGGLDYLQGLKMLGVKRTERVLPTGTPLTVVGEVWLLLLRSLHMILHLIVVKYRPQEYDERCGECCFMCIDMAEYVQAVKDDVGTVRIQRPYKGPFYVSLKSLDQLVANLGKSARWYKYGSLGLTVLGIYLVTKRAIEYVLERRRRREFQKRVLAATAKRSGENAEGGNGQAENGSDSPQNDPIMRDLCVICLVEEYNAVFVPCGHMCCCSSCGSKLLNCPLCRRPIMQAVRTYRH